MRHLSTNALVVSFRQHTDTFIWKHSLALIVPNIQIEGRSCSGINGGRGFIKQGFEGGLDQGFGRWVDLRQEVGTKVSKGAWDRGWKRGLVRLGPGRRLLDRGALPSPAAAADIPAPHHNIQHSNTLQTRVNKHKYKTDEKVPQVKQTK